MGHKRSVMRYTGQHHDTIFIMILVRYFVCLRSSAISENGFSSAAAASASESSSSSSSSSPSES